MKKALIAFAVITVVGILSVVGGIAMLVSGGISIDTIKDIEIEGIPVISVGNKTIEVDETKSQSINGIENIMLKNCACQVNIAACESDEVTVALTGKAVIEENKDINLKVDKKGSELVIEIDSPSINSLEDLFSLDFLSSGSYTDLCMTIAIPKDYIGGLEIVNMAGELDCKLADCTLSEVKTENCAGELNITLSDTGYIDFESDNCAGEIYISGGFSDIECNNTAGEIKITVANDTVESVELDNTAGEIAVYVPKDIKGSVNVKNCLGGFINDFGIKSDEILDYKGEINGGGNFEFSATNTVGEISLLENAA